jgi:micrococcal nuclease
MLENFYKNLEVIVLSILISLNSSGIFQSDIPENKVIKVIDGDTIEIYQNQKIEKIRMIGLNTPETVAPNKDIECYGIEASSKLKDLLQGKIVKLESDETQENKDKYNRLLRYVFLDGKNINQKMIEEGYGFEYTFKKPYRYQKEFKLSESIAKEKNLGLWNMENCNYESK